MPKGKASVRVRSVRNNTRWAAIMVQGVYKAVFSAEKKYKAEGGVKYCRKCHEIKPKTEFYPNKNHKDGLQTCCKVCDKEHGKRKRADGYLPEEGQGIRAYPTQSLVDELKRRGIEGELRITQTVKF